MNCERAKEILSSFRPGSDDEHDPVFTDALQLVERDPELEAWFKARLSFDAAVSRQLAASSMPPNLPEQIRTSVDRRRQATRRRQAVLAAVAACAVLLLTLTGFWWRYQGKPPTSQLAACRRDMVQFLQRFPRLDLETTSLAEARRWLADTHHLQQVQFSTGLERFPTIGCHTLQWHGRSLALVCFMVDGEIVHFIVIPRSSISDSPATSVPQFARVDGTTTVVWSRADLTYLVLTKESENFLRLRM